MRDVKHCGHMFHSDCLESWLKVKSICPICKVDMTEEPKDSENPIANGETGIDFLSYQLEVLIHEAEDLTGRALTSSGNDDYERQDDTPVMFDKRYMAGPRCL